MNTGISNREVSLWVFQSMNNRDFALFDNIFSEDIILDFPGVERIEGKRKVVVFLKTLLLRKYKKLEFTVSEVIVENSKTCVVWTNDGQNANGELYANSGMTLMHFTGDKITFISDYFKDTSFVKI